MQDLIRAGRAVQGHSKARAVRLDLRDRRPQQVGPPRKAGSLQRFHQHHWPGRRQAVLQPRFPVQAAVSVRADLGSSVLFRGLPVRRLPWARHLVRQHLGRSALIRGGLATAKIEQRDPPPLLHLLRQDAPPRHVVAARTPGTGSLRRQLGFGRRPAGPNGGERAGIHRFAGLRNLLQQALHLAQHAASVQRVAQAHIHQGFV
mmetsp:Transcript_82680/g.261137  ORF Transcript_82680/g.261137 Transcript_82680/m.261137 type:complete len:203 (+) Transcript_82680:854-1462(+)